MCYETKKNIKKWTAENSFIVFFLKKMNIKPGTQHTCRLKKAKFVNEICKHGKNNFGVSNVSITSRKSLPTLPRVQSQVLMAPVA